MLFFFILAVAPIANHSTTSLLNGNCVYPLHSVSHLRSTGDIVGHLGKAFQLETTMMEVARKRDGVSGQIAAKEKELSELRRRPRGLSYLQVQIVEKELKDLDQQAETLSRELLTLSRQKADFVEDSISAALQITDARHRSALIIHLARIAEGEGVLTGIEAVNKERQTMAAKQASMAMAVLVGIRSAVTQERVELAPSNGADPRLTYYYSPVANDEIAQHYAQLLHDVIGFHSIRMTDQVDPAPQSVDEFFQLNEQSQVRFLVKLKREIDRTDRMIQDTQTHQNHRASAVHIHARSKKLLADIQARASATSSPENESFLNLIHDIFEETE